MVNGEMKCPSCKEIMIKIGSMLNLGSDYRCQNKNCLFYNIRRYYSWKDIEFVGEKK